MLSADYTKIIDSPLNLSDKRDKSSFIPGTSFSHERKTFCYPLTEIQKPAIICNKVLLQASKRLTEVYDRIRPTITGFIVPR